jgi:hypothetical protein
MDKDTTPPLLAFERWLARAQLAADMEGGAGEEEEAEGAQAPREPLLPSHAKVDRGLIKVRRERATQEEKVCVSECVCVRAQQGGLTGYGGTTCTGPDAASVQSRAGQEDSAGVGGQGGGGGSGDRSASSQGRA